MYDYFLIVKEKFFYSSLEDLILRKIVSIKLIIDGMMLVHFLECLVLFFFFFLLNLLLETYILYANLLKI